MKAKYYLITLIIMLGTNILASEKEDLIFLDELYKQKKFNIAIDESKNFLNRYPTSKYVKSIQDRIAKAYFLEGNYKEAIKYFRMLLLNEDLKAKEKNEINYYLVRSYAGIGDKNKSEEYLKLIDIKNDYYEKAIYDTGTTYLSQENYKDAEIEFQKIIQMKGKYYNEAIISMALLSYNKGEYNRSVAYLNEYSQLKGSKNLIFMNYLLGSAYYKLNQVELAGTYFEKAIKEDKNSVYGKKSALNLIEIYSNKGDTLLAIEKLELLKNSSEYGEGMRIIGDSYATKGDYNKAIEYYKGAEDFSNPKLLYSYGFSLYKLENLKEAQRYFESLKNSSYYNQAMYYIFAIDYKLGNYKKIIKNRDEVKKVVVNQKDTESINLIIANSAYEIGDYKLSKDYYSRVYTSNPNSENLYRIIIIDNKIEDLEDMKLRFQEYKGKYPKDRKYRKNIYLAMGELYYKKGMTEEASLIYKEYLNEAKDFDILNNLIIALLSQQKYDEMMVYLGQTDDSLDSLYLKGIASMGMGKYQEGANYFKSIEENPQVSSELLAKVKFNKVRNNFLWEKYDETVKTGEEYLNTYPNGEGKGEVLDKVAISYFRLDNYEKSKEYYDKLGLIPEFKEYSEFQLADLYYAQGDYSKAKAGYFTVFSKYPNGKYSENANYWYLNTLVNLKEFDLFEKEKDLFLQKYPNSSLKDNIYILAGQIYERKGEKKNLLANYEKLYNSSNNSDVKEEVASKLIDIKLSENSLEEAKKYLTGIGNFETKSYYNSLIYEKQGKKDEAIKEYESLFKGEKYKDYAGVNLGNYWYEKQDYNRAKEYYLEVDKLQNSQYKDYILYQLSTIYELENKNDEALRGYTKGYILYNGEYSNLSKLRGAQLNEKLGKEKEAENLYKELYNIKAFEYHNFIVEKLIFYTLKNGNKIEAEKYYKELQSLDKQTSEKYEQFFN